MRALFSGYNDNIQKVEQKKQEKEREEKEFEEMSKKGNIDAEIQKIRQNYIGLVQNNDGSEEAKKKQEKVMQLMNKLLK